MSTKHSRIHQGAAKQRLVRTWAAVAATLLVVGSAIAQQSGAIAVAPQLDARLIGAWQTGDSYVSGDFSVATEYIVEFRNDGVVLSGKGRVAGGSAAITFDTGEPGAVEQAYWQTQEKILYISESPNGPWEAYARYGLTDDQQTMMLTFGNGNKVLYSRH